MNELQGAIGLAMRAGKLRTGTDQVLDMVRTGKAKLVLLDAGASFNLKKTMNDKCAYYHVPLLELEQDILDQATGNDGKMTAAISDNGFAGMIMKKI